MPPGRRQRRCWSPPELSLWGLGEAVALEPGAETADAALELLVNTGLRVEPGHHVVAEIDPREGVETVSLLKGVSGPFSATLHAFSQLAHVVS